MAAQSDTGDRREEAAGDVRAVYRRVLALGSAHGLPRRPAQTAGEYHTAWRDALPGEYEVGEITATYQQVRYGRAASAPHSGALHTALSRLTENLSASRKPPSPPGTA